MSPCFLSPWHLPLALATLLGLAACDDPPKPAEAAATQAATLAEARRAAEDQVRSRLRMVGDLRLRAVQVYRQQVPDTLAVCGQTNPGGGANDPFIPWVATVTLKDGKAVRTDLVLGVSNMEATRVYIESVDRCFDGGGPRKPRPGRPRPAAAAGRWRPLGRPAAPAPAAPSAAAATPPTTARPTGTVTTTAAHPVNIRSSPAGGGAVVRIVPRASSLRVFAEAPGGWRQVGEDQPFGSVHESMLER